MSSKPRKSAAASASPMEEKQESLVVEDGQAGGPLEPGSDPLESERKQVVRKWVSGPVKKQLAKHKDRSKRTGVLLDVHPKALLRQATRPASSGRTVEREFDQLDDWDEIPTSAVVKPVDDEEVRVAPTVDDEGKVSGDAQSETAPDAGKTAVISAEEPEPSEQAQVQPAPEIIMESVPMKRMEWIGLAALAVFIAAAAVGAYFWSIRLLPHETPSWQQVVFPVKGNYFEIKNAATYWRAPVLEGPNRDPIRRGTRLIPVLELELGGGPAALRVIFRDEEGRGVGDPILRQVPASGKLTLAATAGFEDPGMHAAYRTEGIDPWSVEVSEATAVDLPGSEFSLILKMNLSSDLH